jgi:hypothetical protein
MALRLPPFIAIDANFRPRILAIFFYFIFCRLRNRIVSRQIIDPVVSEQKDFREIHVT